MIRCHRWTFVAALIGSVALTASLRAENPVPIKKTRELASRIDQAINDRLKEEKVAASPQADDAEFLRRVSLDITGIIPSADRAKAFLDSKDADKRAKLIDELLASKDYGKRMADLWQDLLLTRTSENRRLQPQPFHEWLAETFNENKPWDRMVRELLTASGNLEKSPAVTYFLANESVDKITDNVTKNLLGLQLQCAQCHNHPFTGWKQTEYWGMAAFFMKVRSDRVNNAAKNGNSPGVTEGPQINRNKRTLPESAKIVPAKYLLGEEAKLSARDPYRPVLADWITGSKNPYFAKAMVNRVWSMYFGRGLVNPVDDMHEGNVASHPALLNDLAASFTASGYDVKELIRTITLSQAYQRTSKPLQGNEDSEPQLYARMQVKQMTGEMLYDSLVQVAGTQAGGKAERIKGGGKAPARTPRDAFVAFFRGDEGGDPTEYSHGIPQALRLMNSPQFSRPAMIDRLTKNGGKPEQVVEQLYLTTLSRRPTSSEMDRMIAHVKKADGKTGYGDVLWVLLNSSEFVLNR
jgi:hypothetical protein